MSDLVATYTFEGDEIFAIHEGKVIASGNDMPSVESDAVEYLESLTKERKHKEKESTKKTATHIITPNGLKGEILGRTPAVWGEQITARFENNHISTFITHGEDNVEWITEKQHKIASGPTDKLSERLDAEFEHDRKSLAVRHDELISISKEASSLIANGAPYIAEVKLDQIRTAADNERLQIKEAIDHLQDADAIAPPSFDPQVFEQADIGHSSDWLDATTQQMIQESEDQDLDKLISEGPSVFVTELDNGALADAGVTREMAFAHIVSKTAGFAGEEIEDFRDKFVARAEVARRHELASRKQTIHKEAAAEQELEINAPDEALFI